MGGKRFALLAAAVLAAMGTFGCVGDSVDSTEEPAAVGVAQEKLDPSDVADTTVIEGEATTNVGPDEDDGASDPEPGPWRPNTREEARPGTINPGDPESDDPEPAPWQPGMGHHNK